MFRIIFLCFFTTIQCEHNFRGPAVYKLAPPVEHGECPTWDSRNNILYYVDLPNGRIISYDYSTQKQTSIVLNGSVAPVIPTKSDPHQLIVGLNRSIVAVRWDKENDVVEQKVLVTVAEDKPESRLNEGKADEKGRIWFGTMGRETREGDLTPNQGTLFRMTNDLKPVPVIHPVNISNGMAWNKANNKLYYIDSPSRQIAEYDHDEDTGEIKNRRTVFDFAQNDITDAVPDGMTIDVDDNLWIALYGGGSVVNVNPTTGEVLNRIPIPASSVTSVVWGGPKLDILFVTTSKISLTDKQKAEQPGAGCLYAVTDLGTSGHPMFEADIV